MPDLYECHRRAVEEWLKTCQAVEAAEYNREAARAILDKASADLLAACQDPHKSRPIVKRGRKAKSNGVDFKAMMREERDFDANRHSALPRSE